VNHDCERLFFLRTKKHPLQERHEILLFSVPGMETMTNKDPTMSIDTQSSEYLLLFRSTDWDKDLSPRDLQRIMSETMAWFDGIRQQGKHIGAQPLFGEGRTVSGKKGRTVADGPFAESKEAVAGYLLLAASDMEEAVQIAKGWPLLEFGGTVEIRPVAPECASFARIREEMSHATA
jgi:hypothetical protein